MAIRVIRNPKESVDRCISRFNKLVQSSRILNLLKSRRYFQRPVTKGKRRKAALMREKYRSQKDKLRFY